MIAGAPDRAFGNSGTIWSGIPTPYQVPFHVGSYPAYVGGTAIGLEWLDETPALVVQGWVQDQQGPRQGPEDVRWLTSAVAVVPPADGRPDEAGIPTGTQVFPLTRVDRRAEPIASCVGVGGTACVLVRTAAVTGGSWTYAVCVVGPTGPAAVWPVKRAWLFEPATTPLSGSVRIVVAGTKLVIVSTQRDRLRVTVAPRAGATRTATFALAKVGKGNLRGLTRLSVASVRTWGSTLSVAMTAERKDVAGTVSQGVLAKLQIGAAAALDRGFGSGGLWVSPLLTGGRAFVCGGEVSRGIAGVAGSAAVAFGVSANGRGLDPTFGIDGVCEADLGGALSSPVVTNDRDEFIYIFAQRQSDLRTVGCRIRVRSGLFPVPNGTLDPNFGAGGTITLGLDGAPAQPAAIVAGNLSVVVAATRSIRGSDCDRVPALVTLQRSDGAPDVTFGAGGFALHGSVGAPAAFAADGSCLFAGPARVPGVHLRVTTPDGAAGRLIEPTLPVGGPEVTSMRWLADGSQLISGTGTAGWIGKLTPGGALDVNFGTAGVTQPHPTADSVRIVGARADGRIAIQCRRDGWPVVALLQPNGTVDPTFGDAGFQLAGRLNDDARAFLADDGSLLCVCSTRHTVGKPRTNALGLVTNEFVQVGLVRITSDGAYDPAFGWCQGQMPPLGLPVFPPGAQTLTLPAAVTAGTVDDALAYVTAVGIGLLGARYYLIATGFAGGREVVDAAGIISYLPTWPMLVVSRWNADGTPDSTFARQIGGYTPERRFWTAIGVLAESASSLLAFGWASPRNGAGGAGGAPGQPRQLQPALFRISHPGGIDVTFGPDGNGAATMALQEFGPAAACAGIVLAGGKVRLAVADLVLRFYHPQNAPLLSYVRADSSFGGLAQFT